MFVILALGVVSVVGIAGTLRVVAMDGTRRLPLR